MLLIVGLVRWRYGCNEEVDWADELAFWLGLGVDMGSKYDTMILHAFELLGRPDY
jgi:hypothetical protein